MPRSKPKSESDLVPTAATVRDKAIELLARREHTRLELTRKLRKRELPADLIEQVLQALVKENLLSETRYAEMLVRSRVNKGCGPLRIFAEAQDVGADEALIQQALEEEAVDWVALAQAAMDKRFGRLAKTPAERVKQSRFLAGRGFTAETVRQVVGDIYD